MNTLDHDVYSMFAHLEDDLLDAVLCGRPALESFVERLSIMHKTASSAISSKVLSSKSLELIRNVARSGSLVADNIIQLRSDTQKVDEHRQADISDVFRRMSLCDAVPRVDGLDTENTPSLLKKPTLQPFRQPSSRQNSVGCDSDSVAPSKARTLHEWLLENIHSPFTNKHSRKLLAEETGIPEKDIANWMVQMRRRIGWSAIVKKHFNKDKALAVDFASRVFFGSESTYPLDQSIAREFLSVREATQRLFEENYVTSELVKKIEELAREVPVPQNSLISRSRCRRSKGTTKQTVQQLSADSQSRTAVWVFDSASTPRCGTAASDNVATRSEDMFKRKRHSTSESGSDNGSNSTSKRRRTSSSERSEVSTDESTTGPSTPYSASTSLLADFDRTPLQDEAIHGLLNIASECQSSSKRRLSISDFSDSAPVTKRHRGSFDTLSDTRLETVDALKPSTLLPSQSCSDESEMMRQLEYALGLDMPNEADLGVRPPDGELEVNLFDYSGWADIGNSQTTSELDPLLGEDIFTTVTDGDNLLQFHAINSPSTIHESYESLDDLLRQLDSGVADLPITDVALYPNYEQGITSSIIMAENHSPYPTNHSHIPAPSDPILAFDSSDLSQNQTVSESPISDPTSVSMSDLPAISTECGSMQYSVFNDWTSASSLEDADKKAKLERLRSLREQKCRLAEEERLLEQDLISFSTA